ncbi:MAG: DUF3107 domain-containing protein [Actinomycetota bacterium]|nr:DUF3107 domain-containing protein [Actinomycetota bacterium]
MEVKIGVQNSARELTVDTTDSSEDIEKLVAKAVTSDGVLTLTDSRGRKVIIPASRLAYVEVGGGVSGQVGFRS